MTTPFTSAQAELLLASMPELQFNLQHDADWTGADLVQHYVDFYRINFAKTQQDVVHGFGFLDVCNFRIATQYWMPQHPRGTLVVLHGYFDHVGIFSHVIAYGLANGLAVLAFDLPGHGLSSGERVAIESFDHYGDVLNAILNRAQDFFPQPLYALGQSTGAAILLNYLWRYAYVKPEAKQFYRIALCAPLVLPRAWFFGRIHYALAHKFVRYINRGLSRNSHDKHFIDFVDNRDCLQSKKLSVVWVGAMKAWDQQFRRFTPITAPLLIVQGTGDLTVAWRYNMTLMQQKLPNADIHYIAEAGHQLVNESSEYRTPVFTKISQYFFND